jgi:hypothetical protein
MDRRDRLKTGAGPAPFFRGKTAAHAKSGNGVDKPMGIITFAHSYF